MTRVRILILTSSTGAGHDARAQAFAEWCFELYRHNVDVRIEQMLENSSGFFSAGVRFYNWIQKKSPWIHKAFYLFVELLSLLNRNSVSFGRRYYEAVRHNPELAVRDAECEQMCYIAWHLYHERFGDMPPSGISRETCSNLAGWPKDD